MSYLRDIYSQLVCLLLVEVFGRAYQKASSPYLAVLLCISLQACRIDVTI